MCVLPNEFQLLNVISNNNSNANSKGNSKPACQARAFPLSVRSSFCTLIRVGFKHMYAYVSLYVCVFVCEHELA